VKSIVVVIIVDLPVPVSNTIFRRNVLYLSLGLIIAVFAIFLNPRSLSTVTTPNNQQPIDDFSIMATPSLTKLDVAKNKKRFLDVFPNVVEELLDTVRVENMPNEVVEWYKRVRNFATQEPRING
jgi:hypothetical protein